MWISLSIESNMYILKQGLIAENQFFANTDQIISAAMARASASEMITSIIVICLKFLPAAGY